MIFRKANVPTSTTGDLDGRDRGRRGRRIKDDVPTWPEEESAGELTDVPSADGARARSSKDHGPYDASEVDSVHDPLAAGRVDLGGLQVRAIEGIELRLQVDEASQAVVAALFVRGDAALELRAFAAPRSSGLWDEIRREIAVETTRRGGVVTETTGPFGTELKVVVPTRTPDGQQVTQASRIVGVDGPRWFLRGTLIGRAAADPEAAGPLLAAMSEIVVIRGKAPMAPRDMIPLQIPEAARMVAPGAGQQ
ncbi:DUF3710 domain-containing protein [Actinopolymorpha alba]|uniref:DUF3710 domain-containing protein n=1 Tax=Actinopolymorpha alba TaxID=533267 RepID=UPI000363C301|nr:DUF3710 domain-containing protein [Actinopolymorpha alba]